MSLHGTSLHGSSLHSSSLSGSLHGGSLHGSSTHTTRSSLSDEGTKGGSSHARKYMSDGFEPGENDVMCGRGNICTKHQGNLKLAELVKTYIPQYTREDGGKRTKREKSVILTQVVEEVRKKCGGEGGFVKKDPMTGRWYEVGDFLAREKVSQAFRDCLHENYKSSCASKSKRRKEELRRPGLLMGDRANAHLQAASALQAAAAMADLANQSGSGAPPPPATTPSAVLTPTAAASAEAPLSGSQMPSSLSQHPGLLKPSPNDVIMGRQRWGQSHPGNVQFRATVESLVLHFAQAADDMEKKTQIVDLVLSQVNGCFLRWHEGHWCVLDSTQMREEVLLAFHESLALHREQEQVLKCHNSATEANFMPEAFEPGDNDVVCGGGKENDEEKAKAHMGNVKFRAIVQSFLFTYSRSLHDVHEKTRILLLVLDQVHGRGGKFVRWQEAAKRWQEMDLAGTRQVVVESFTHHMEQHRIPTATTAVPTTGIVGASPPISPSSKRLRLDVAPPDTGLSRSHSEGAVSAQAAAEAEAAAAARSAAAAARLESMSAGASKLPGSVLTSSARAPLGLQPGARLPPSSVASLGGDAALLLEIQQLRRERTLLAAAAGHATPSLAATRSALAASTAALEQEQRLRERAIIAEAEAAAAAAYKDSPGIGAFPSSSASLLEQERARLHAASSARGPHLTSPPPLVIQQNVVAPSAHAGLPPSVVVQRDLAAAQSNSKRPYSALSGSAEAVGAHHHSSQHAVVVQQTPGHDYPHTAASHIPPSVVLQTGAEASAAGHASLGHPHHPRAALPAHASSGLPSHYASAATTTVPSSTTVVYYQTAPGAPAIPAPQQQQHPAAAQQQVLVVLPSSAGGAQLHP